MSQNKNHVIGFFRRTFAIKSREFSVFFSMFRLRKAVLLTTLPILIFGALINAQPVRAAVYTPCDPHQSAANCFTNGNNPLQGLVATAAAGLSGTGDLVLEGGAMVVDVILKVILQALGWGVHAAVAIFAYAVDPGIMNNLQQNTNVYKWWKMVRDTLNIFFIGVLLLSAFSTIFQVQKYHYSKILLNLIIMALLVNFSFPIARFVIDFSNRMMYFLMDLSGMTASSAMNTLTNSSGVLKLIEGNYSGTDSTAILLVSVIFTFIFMIAVLTLAVLMMVRLVALLFIVIFSPIGFVGQIVPGMGGYASKWWGMLFKYAFFGPAAMLMLSISTSMMASISMQGAGMSSVVSQSGATTAGAKSIVEIMALFSLPIIMIYLTVSMGSRMSIYGAKSVEGYSSKAMKWGSGWALALGTAGAYPFGRNAYNSWDKSREQARQQAKMRWGGNLGKWGANKQDQITSVIAPLPGARKDAARRAEAYSEKNNDELVKALDEAGTSNARLKEMVKHGSQKEANAAMRLLAKREAILDPAELESALDNNNLSKETKLKAVEGASKEALAGTAVFEKAMRAVGDDSKAAAKLMGKASRDSFADLKDPAKMKALTDLAAFKNENGGAALKRSMVKQMKEEGMAHLAIPLEAERLAQLPSTHQDYGKSAQEVLLRGMNVTQMTSQSKDFYDDAEIKAYLADDTQVNNKKLQELWKQSYRDKGTADAQNALDAVMTARGLPTTPPTP